jgi:hypothetical protein
MGLRLPRVNEWLYTVSSRGITTRPSTLLSKSVVPAQNAYGAYTQLIAGANVTDDCYEFDLLVGTVAIAASARDCIVTIGIDEAGGAAYTPVWSDIVVGPAGTYFSAGAYNAVGFRIPLKIKAGTSVAIKASVNSATLTAIVADCILRGRPTRPDLVWAGSYVRTYGANTAASAGATVVPGTNAEGVWAQIGTIAADDKICFWEFGYGINDATMTGIEYNVDIGLGDANNKRVIIESALVVASGNETLLKMPGQGRYAMGYPGDIVYARSQSSNNTIDDFQSVAVYGVG